MSSVGKKEMLEADGLRGQLSSDREGAVIMEISYKSQARPF